MPTEPQRVERRLIARRVASALAASPADAPEPTAGAGAPLAAELASDCAESRHNSANATCGPPAALAWLALREAEVPGGQCCQWTGSGARATAMTMDSMWYSPATV